VHLVELAIVVGIERSVLPLIRAGLERLMADRLADGATDRVTVGIVRHVWWWQNVRPSIDNRRRASYDHVTLWAQSQDPAAAIRIDRGHRRVAEDGTRADYGHRQ
jgi:hypothetical protein